MKELSETRPTRNTKRVLNCLWASARLAQILDRSASALNSISVIGMLPVVTLSDFGNWAVQLVAQLLYFRSFTPKDLRLTNRRPGRLINDIGSGGTLLHCRKWLP